MSEIFCVRLSKADLQTLLDNDKLEFDIPHGVKFDWVTELAYSAFHHIDGFLDFFRETKLRGISFEIEQNSVKSFFLEKKVGKKGKASKYVEIDENCLCFHPDSSNLKFDMDESKSTSLQNIIENKNNYHLEFWNENEKKDEVKYINPKFVLFEQRGIESLLKHFDYFVLSGNAGMLGIGVKPMKNYASLKIEGFPEATKEDDEDKIINTLVGLPCPPSWG